MEQDSAIGDSIVLNENDDDDDDENGGEFIDFPIDNYKSLIDSKCLDNSKASELSWNMQFETPNKNANALNSSTFPKTSTPSMSFRTGNNQKIDISDKSYRNALKFLISDESDLKHEPNSPGSAKLQKDNTNDNSNLSIGQSSHLEAPALLFTTGSNKPVAIKDESLKAAKLLLENDDDGDDAEFNEKVIIETESIEQPNLPDNPPEVLSQSFFQTAKGDDVFVSQDALNHIRSSQIDSQKFIASQGVDSLVKPFLNRNNNICRSETSHKTPSKFGKHNSKSIGNSLLKNVSPIKENKSLTIIPYNPEYFDVQKSSKVYCLTPGNTVSDILRKYCRKFKPETQQCNSDFDDSENPKPPELPMDVSLFRDVEHQFDFDENHKISKPFDSSLFAHRNKFQFTIPNIFIIFSKYLENCGIAFDEDDLLRWFCNHFFLIAWRNVAFELEYPWKYRSLLFTPNTILLNLAERYSLEYLSVRHSILRKICEKNEPPNVKMILFVTRVYRRPLLRLFVSDGWYEIEAELDPAFATLINKSLIRIGQKLMTLNAVLCGENCREAQNPLHLQKTQLKIFTNSTFPSKFNATLGKSRNLGLPLTPLIRIHKSGGLVPLIKFKIIEIFPIQDPNSANNEEISNIDSGIPSSNNQNVPPTRAQRTLPSILPLAIACLARREANDSIFLLNVKYPNQSLLDEIKKQRSYYFTNILPLFSTRKNAGFQNYDNEYIMCFSTTKQSKLLPAD